MYRGDMYFISKATHSHNVPLEAQRLDHLVGELDDRDVVLDRRVARDGAADALSHAVEGGGASSDAPSAAHAAAAPRTFQRTCFEPEYVTISRSRS